ncbi:hypothetical protein SVIOM342S_02871 [Streptomyces violaceorubidus]
MDQDVRLVVRGDGDDLQVTGARIAYDALGVPPALKRIGCPCSRRITASSACSLSLRASKAPSLKMLQFW